MDNNRLHCKSIADRLEKIHNGELRCCPECGAEIIRDWDNVGDKFRCPNCHETTDTEDYVEKTLWDEFAGDPDIYDIEYTIGSDKQFRAVRLMVACGGPNIFINTKTKNVELYWWSESAFYPMSYDVVNEIEEIFEELYLCS